MGDIIVWDTETTGLVQPSAIPIEKQPQMIEFAGIKLSDELKEIDRLEFLVNPGIELPKIITNITGIKDRDLEGKATFPEHLNALQDFFLGTEEMVAHNLMFDHDILMYELMRLDKVTQFPWPPKRTCTVEATHHIHGYRMNLTKLHKYCTGEDFKDAHRAMADVEVLTRDYVWLKQQGVIQ